MNHRWTEGADIATILPGVRPGDSVFVPHEMVGKVLEYFKAKDWYFYVYREPHGLVEVLTKGPKTIPLTRPEEAYKWTYKDHWPPMDEWPGIIAARGGKPGKPPETSTPAQAEASRVNGNSRRVERPCPKCGVRCDSARAARLHCRSAR